jgi:arylsulfatase A-like enzyme
MKRLPLLLLWAACCTWSAAVEAAQRPNVIVVITDDQGYGDFSCHGNPVLKTPNLDRLRSESLRFSDFHVSPMCTPTRGQLLTGLDCLRNGAMNVSSGRTLLRREAPTMANLFADAGYQCGHFGKWHLGDNYPYRPQDRGFHETVYYPSSHISSAPDFWNNDYFDDTYWHNGVRQKYEGYTTDVFFNEAIGWMKSQQQADKPFFCYLATAAAHGPLFVPDKYRQPYQKLPRNVASFFGMVANIDENIGRLESFLADSGLRDDTILVFLNDNGGTAGVSVYNAGLRGRKIELYEGGHRAACFLRWPQGKLRAACDIGELTHVQDILPTLSDLCGFTVPANRSLDGMSLAPLLKSDDARLPDRTLVIQFSRMNAPRPKQGDACVLWRNWRLVSDKELYDVAHDPGQKQDVAAEHPDIVARLREHYASWWSGVEPQVNQFSRLVLGSDRQNPTTLSPCEWADVFLDQSRQIRGGVPRNGVWHVEVERDGQYEFTLRRWPAEAMTPLAAAAPAYQGEDGSFPAGVALPIAQARIKIAGSEQSIAVKSDDSTATFTIDLSAGPAELQTWFLAADGRELCGAYYVTVERK